MWRPPLHQTDRVECFIQIARSLAGGDEVFEVIVQLQAFASFPLYSSMNSESGFSICLTESQTPPQSRQASNGL